MLAVRRILLLAGAVLCATASLNPLVAQQPTGTITGQVIDSATRQPLVGVNVVVEGTRLGAITRDDGTFTIVGVPAGTHTVRARRIGYGSMPVIVNVTDGSMVSVAFSLEKRASRNGPPFSIKWWSWDTPRKEKRASLVLSPLWRWVTSSPDEFPMWRRRYKGRLPASL